VTNNSGKMPEREHRKERLPRRQAIARMLALLAATVAPESIPRSGRAREMVCDHLALEAGLPEAGSPDLPGSFTPEQKATVALLADLIIPPDEVAPGAKAAKVEDYIDFVVAHSAPDIQKQWTEGLRALDDFSRQRAGGPIPNLSSGQQEALLAEIARGETSPSSAAEHFFVRLKRATAQGFYTSKIGLLDDLKYQGNSYVEGPATCHDKFDNHASSSAEPKPACAGGAEHESRPSRRRTMN